MKLLGKTAIVSGGGTGIGKSVALSLANEGANVVVCGRRQEPLDQVIESGKDHIGEIMAFPADVSNEEDVRKLVETTLEVFNHRVDILINNAGIGGGGYIHEHDIPAWDRIMAINLRGPFLLARQVVPLMRQQSGGHIINISSESGLEFYQGDGAYGVAKHALNALSEFIQRENQEFNIRVNTICPGMVITEMTADLENLIHEKSLYPEDIADLVIWLVSRRPNVKIGTPVLIQTMENPWKA